jgi:hypothetical protein
MAADQQRVLEDIDAARRGGGLSNRDVGRACGVDPSTVWRILHADTRVADLQLQACIAAAVGLDLRLHAFPAGDPIRDAGQARLLERLRRDLGPGLRWRTEVPLPIEGDLRAWDAGISGSDWRLMVEAETVIADVQALERRLARKLRDGGVDHCLLLVADTPRNRQAVAAAPAAFAAWPLRTRDILAALRSGRRPGAGGIVFR